MVTRAAGVLQGMKEICLYVNRSEATVVRWIKEFAFPASKIAGGTWESDKALVDDWRRKSISEPPSGTKKNGEESLKKKWRGGRKKRK